MTRPTVLSRAFRFAPLVLTAWLAASAAAQDDEAATLTPEQQAAAAQWAEAIAAMVPGPQSISLIDQGQLALPEGFGFVPKAEATTMMELMGNRVDDRFIGLVFPLEESQDYFVSLEYEESGYIEDDEAAEDA